MTLYLVGIGLCDERDITVKGLDIVRKASKIYLEGYTAVLQVPVKRLEEFYGRDVNIVNRDFVERKAESMLKEAKAHDVCLLIVGDPMVATTHSDIILRARDSGVKVEIIDNASIFTAVGRVGLQLYKFGRTTSMPFPEKNFQPETAYDVIKDNGDAGMHTLVLLDLRPDKQRFMRVNDALDILLNIALERGESAINEDTCVVGCARLGCPNELVSYGKISVLKHKDFGRPMHCLIFPGKLHFAEEEMLKRWQ